MEHFGLGRPEETYVEMNEDGSKKADEPRRKPREPVLARQSSASGAKETLDTTLTYENDESPRYCEIEEKSHYELLSNARTATAQQTVCKMHAQLPRSAFLMTQKWSLVIALPFAQLEISMLKIIEMPAKFY